MLSPEPTPLETTYDDLGLTNTVTPDFRAAATHDATRQLLAAANLHNGRIYEALRARFEDDHNLKAHTPEYFIDIEEVLSEARAAHDREILKKGLLLAGSLVGLGASLVLGVGVLVMTGMVLAAVEFWFDVRCQRYVRSRFLPGSYIPDTSSSAAVGDNVVVSGGYSPFVGSGHDIHGWSFTVDLTKASSGEEPRRLTVQELYDEVTGSVRELQIPGLTMSDKLFVHGSDIRPNEQLLPDVCSKPYTAVRDEYLRRFIGLRDSDIRHYRVFQVPAWKGQLVLSVFLRFTPIGKGLFVEARFSSFPH